MLLNCPICGKQFNCTPSRFNKIKDVPCCSRECAAIQKEQKQEKNCICSFCGKKFHKKQSHIDKVKKYNYCSMECLANHRKIIYKGIENPNAFCRIKPLNKIKHCGYYWVYLPNHPFASNDYVREHRLIAEQYLLTEENSVTINGEKYLSPNFEVHHKDLNKLNNNIDNLLVVTKTEHQKIHWQIKNEAMELYKKQYNL